MTINTRSLVQAIIAFMTPSPEPITWQDEWVQALHRVSEPGYVAPPLRPMVAIPIKCADSCGAIADGRAPVACPWFCPACREARLASFDRD